MKCKNWSNKLNDFVVRKLKSFKINGQQKTSVSSVSTTTMPTIPKEKATPMPLTKNSFDDIKFRTGGHRHHHHHQHQQQQQQEQLNQQQQQQKFIVMGQKSPSKILTTSTAVAATEITMPPSSPSSTNPTKITSTHEIDENSFLNEKLLAKLSITAQDIIDDIKSTDAANGVSPNKMSVDDFIFGRSVGEGSFSTVYQAKDVHTNKEYAIKVCDKQHILRERKQEYVRREREAMQIMCNTPGFVNLSGTFQDYQNLYFVMTYAKNGDLLPYIQKVGSFDLDCARYYAAELLISIEHMHKKGIIHRDLKPENILLDKDMHTLITDFGSVKILGSDCNNMETSPNRRRRCSFVGTAQYVSPEVLLGQDITRAADLWALGCIIYQMLTGLYPFRGDNEYLIFKEILNLNLEFPENFDRDAADLIRSLLKLNAEDRIGFQDKIGRYESIRTHPFFDEINWDVVRKQTPPQICSCVMDMHKHDDDENDDEFLCSR